MKITIAKPKDIAAINGLLKQVLGVHNAGRPDLFIKGGKKYTDSQLIDIINNPNTPIFIAKEDEKVLGYAFCQRVQHLNDNILTPVLTLYIDDLCVDENARGNGVGKALYNFVKEYAKQNGYYNLTLNVWSCNAGAMQFYQKMGLKPYKVGMEEIL